MIYTIVIDITYKLFNYFYNYYYCYNSS